jgi:thioredoxin 1
MTQVLDIQNFDATIKNNDVVLVDFYADWCGPCKSLAPTLENLANQYDGKAVVAKVNVDKNPELSAKFGVRSIPALFYFKNGELVGKQTGVQSQAHISENISNLLNKN